MQSTAINLYRKGSSKVKNNPSTPDGAGASPAASKPPPVIIINPPYNNKIQSKENEVLFLTSIRSFQQNRNNALIKEQISQRIRETKNNLKGKRFQVKDKPPKFCKNHKMVLLSCVNGEIEKARFTRIGCKSWTCPACCISKALKVKYLLRDVIRTNNLTYFLTLTLDPQRIPQEDKQDTHKYITKLFNHFVTILKRNPIHKGILQYVWVIEFQKNGNAHLHIFLNKFLPITIIRSLWVHVGGGHIMRIEKVKTIQGISNYVSDYIVKGIKGDLERESGFRYFQRRYSISKSCVRTKVNKKELFPLLSLQEQYHTLQSLGLGWVYNTLYDLEEKDIVIRFGEEKT